MKSYSVVIALVCLIGSSKNAAAMRADTTINYSESTADIVNPERGFYRQQNIFASNYVPLDKNTLIGYRTNQKVNKALYSVSSSLVYVEYILDSFIKTPISASFLKNFNQDCATARAAGVKLIVRFCYVNKAHGGNCGDGICPPYGDASKPVVLNHIKQLKPYLQQNVDIIACMQMGFIGIWGENYYSDYFGDASNSGNGRVLDSNWRDRTAVLKALLNALPKSRMIQVRVPQLKQRYVYGVSAGVQSAALNEAEAFSGTDKARIGFHNDCFLSGPTDYGTYNDYGNSSSPQKDATPALREFEMADSRYTVVGGETCDDTFSPQNDCGPTGRAQQEFAGFHYSFLNSAYNTTVNDDWVTGGCMDEIKQKMGYRFVLRSATISTRVKKGGTIRVALNIQNVGYASPYNARPVQLVLKNKADGKVTAITFKTDIRRWFTGTIDLHQNLALPAGLKPGRYEVYLNMPDAAARISARPEYSIQLANQDLWEAGTGYNKLNAIIQVN
ncbi:DUF4832 domain-containing protein [Mucilaginibacter sp. UR6-11]|uniref:DUF4832 domain-containing protein n=1 Tax=Mucilaginibacter sp. UR6-11 TaxID=1435644 RepID=UPI001E4FCAEA|nr:DUF4832 domain-containing protein [Mucilaginibacter sp. UR6-11]MCC8423687.1 DUF4832 domain-containing protein [Mucilaginibacter sp. UR6-11]